MDETESDHEYPPTRDFCRQAVNVQVTVERVSAGWKGIYQSQRACQAVAGMQNFQRFCPKRAFAKPPSSSKGESARNYQDKGPFETNTEHKKQRRAVHLQCDRLPKIRAYISMLSCVFWS
jgi:hypothetical protein